MEITEKEELTNLCKYCEFLNSEKSKVFCSVKKRLLDISDYYGVIISINKCRYYKEKKE